MNSLLHGDDALQYPMVERPVPRLNKMKDRFFVSELPAPTVD